MSPQVHVHSCMHECTHAHTQNCYNYTITTFPFKTMSTSGLGFLSLSLSPPLSSLSPSLYTHHKNCQPIPISSHTRAVTSSPRQYQEKTKTTYVSQNTQTHRFLHMMLWHTHNLVLYTVSMHTLIMAYIKIL